MAAIPAELWDQSLNPRELVFEYQDALQAIDRLEALGIQILGWEAWVRHPDGSFGHPSSVIGSGDLDSHADAGQFCRRTIAEAYGDWITARRAETICFCITTASA